MKYMDKQALLEIKLAFSLYCIDHGFESHLGLRFFLCPLMEIFYISLYFLDDNTTNNNFNNN